MALVNRTVADLLVAFRSAEPTPGGGSAAALAGALGASLLAMVAGLPKSRATTEEDAQRLNAAGERCTALALELETLVDRDSEAYNLVMGAYKKPKATDEDKAARSAAIQAAFARRLPRPRRHARVRAPRSRALSSRVGNPSASSDLQVGFELLSAVPRREAEH